MASPIGFTTTKFALSGVSVSKKDICAKVDNLAKTTQILPHLVKLALYKAKNNPGLSDIKQLVEKKAVHLQIPYRHLDYLITNNHIFHKTLPHTFKTYLINFVANEKDVQKLINFLKGLDEELIPSLAQEGIFIEENIGRMLTLIGNEFASEGLKLVKKFYNYYKKVNLNIMVDNLSSHLSSLLIKVSLNDCLREINLYELTNEQKIGFLHANITQMPFRLKENDNPVMEIQAILNTDYAVKPEIKKPIHELVIKLLENSSKIIYSESHKEPRLINVKLTFELINIALENFIDIQELSLLPLIIKICSKIENPNSLEFKYLGLLLKKHPTSLQQFIPSTKVISNLIIRYSTIIPDCNDITLQLDNFATAKNLLEIYENKLEKAQYARLIMQLIINYNQYTTNGKIETMEITTSLVYVEELLNKHQSLLRETCGEESFTSLVNQIIVSYSMNAVNICQEPTIAYLNLTRKLLEEYINFLKETKQAEMIRQFIISYSQYANDKEEKIVETAATLAHAGGLLNKYQHLLTKILGKEIFVSLISQVIKACSMIIYDVKGIEKEIAEGYIAASLLDRYKEILTEKEYTFLTANFIKNCTTLVKRENLTNKKMINYDLATQWLLKQAPKLAELEDLESKEIWANCMLEVIKNYGALIWKDSSKNPQIVDIEQAVNFLVNDFELLENHLFLPTEKNLNKLLNSQFGEYLLLQFKDLTTKKQAIDLVRQLVETKIGLIEAMPKTILLPSSLAEKKQIIESVLPLTEFISILSQKLNQQLIIEVIERFIDSWNEIVPNKNTEEKIKQTLTSFNRLLEKYTPFLIACGAPVKIVNLVDVIVTKYCVKVNQLNLKNTHMELNRLLKTCESSVKSCKDNFKDEDTSNKPSSSSITLRSTRQIHFEMFIDKVGKYIQTLRDHIGLRTPEKRRMTL